MKYKINWKKIDGGYKGFEKLAVRYVQTEYDSRFCQTSDTRDGNKDAVLEDEIYTIILGYQATSKSIEEWWMEAKYSDSREILPRYRLDATLVSAILKGNVKHIFFVTNTNIQSQVINDIRQAIIGTTVCQNVTFCTRTTLEYWLYENTDVLREFFPDYNNKPIELEKQVLVDKINYYTSVKINYIFKEKLSVLELGQIYCAEFSVFSSVQEIVTLRLNSALNGIKFMGRHKYTLHNGINNIYFEFMLKENYGYKSQKRHQEHMLLPEPSFQLGTLQIISADNILVNKDTVPQYDIISQKAVKNEILNFFASIRNKTGTNLFYLYGQLGAGKSYVLNNYLNSSKRFMCPSFFCEMTGNYNYDLQNIIDCVNYIYFPFIPSDSITPDYLKQIGNNNYIPENYKKLISLHGNEEISIFLHKYISENVTLFPKRMYTNQRQIIIDDIHKASNIIINALYKIIIEQSMINAPLRILFSGQWVRHTEIYTKLCSLVNVEEKELCITADDCLNLLSCPCINDRLRVYLNSNLLFSNIIELLMFARYVHESTKNIIDMETFQILYHLFFQERILDMYLKRLFDNTLSCDEEAAVFCNKVYWNLQGILRTNTEVEQKLLCQHIVKLDATAQRVIPYHDLYAKCYRKNFVCKQLLDIPFAQLLEAGNCESIKSIANRLHTEYLRKNYILVYYTLEPIYTHANSFKNLMDEIMYYTLFQDFAHSCAFCSIDYSGSILFERIYNETKLLYNPSQQIYMINIAALWELTNSTFESLKYKKALMLCDELQKRINYLAECAILVEAAKENIYYHNVNVIRSMIKSELQEGDCELFFQWTVDQMLAYHKQERLWSFRVRYSLTIMQRDYPKALQLLQQCKQYYESNNYLNEKNYLWSCFYISYIKMITSTEMRIKHQEESMALLILEKVKDAFFNDYRKMIYGMILYYYSCNRKDEAEIFLMKDCHVLREKRPRLKGFEYLIFALQHILGGNSLSALNELKNAYTIFKHIPSYCNLIKHNMDLVMAKCSIKSIQYYLGGYMEDDIYYIDIRGCW